MFSKKVNVSVIFIIVAAIAVTLVAIQISFKKNSQLVNPQFKTYTSKYGWKINYPATWDKTEADFIQETSTGKTLSFNTQGMVKEKLEEYMNNEISRLLSAKEAKNSEKEPLKKTEIGNLVIYSFAHTFQVEGSTYIIKSTYIYNSTMNQITKFNGSIPSLTETEYENMVMSYETINFLKDDRF